MIGRFAPSPTGRMHLGNIWVALLSDLAVHAQGGQQILRIEDLDRDRSSENWIRQLTTDLAWLGLTADLGGKPDQLIRQSERDEIYMGVFKAWQADGRVYPCYCRRADLLAASAPHLDDGHRVYTGTCRPSGMQEPESLKQPGLTRVNTDTHGARQTVADGHCRPSWRLAVDPVSLTFTDLIAGTQTIDLALEWGDFVIRRADGVFAYQLACAVDDACLGVDLVVRGRDLLRSTFPQLYIHSLLGRPAPVYAHVPLLVDASGHRLSKRQRSLDLGALQAAGLTANQLIGYLAWLAGLIDRVEPITVRELHAHFTRLEDLRPLHDYPERVVDPVDLYDLLNKNPG